MFKNPRTRLIQGTVFHKNLLKIHFHFLRVGTARIAHLSARESEAVLDDIIQLEVGSFDVFKTVDKQSESLDFFIICP